MTTTEPQPYVPSEQDYIQIAVPGVDYSKAFIPWNADFPKEMGRLREFRDAFYAAFYPTPDPGEPERVPVGDDGIPLPEPPPVYRAPQRPTPTPQRPVGANGNASGPVYMTERCDTCGGAVRFKEGFTSKQGKDISPSLTCAGPCKDKGKYPHHVRWLEQEELVR